MGYPLGVNLVLAIRTQCQKLTEVLSSLAVASWASHWEHEEHFSHIHQRVLWGLLSLLEQPPTLMSSVSWHFWHSLWPHLEQTSSALPGWRVQLRLRLEPGRNQSKTNFRINLLIRGTLETSEQPDFHQVHRHHCFPREMTFEEREENFYTDDAVLLIGWCKFPSRHYQSEELPRSG